MHPDLDTLKNELPPYLESRGMIVFHGESRLSDQGGVVMWDVERRPDFREFIECTQRLGVKLVVLHAREFEQQSIDDVMEELAESEMPQPERREMERRLKKLTPYTGFTSQIEISFDYEDKVYMYEARSEFMNELLSIMSDIDLWLPPGEESEEDDGPMGGGFFSRN
ncbi:MAG: hypothetical protein ACK58M_06485 [Acidobacteriota bacterium]|jgi:hypothetical protein|nr:hypothetical protein [Bryobacteraceae bacterium CoA2 C42]MCA2962928.1 hypothetical protein [Acidobacteriaceae bacterium]